MGERLKHIPKSGAWIMIRKVIPVGIPIDPLSLWFAKPSRKVFLNGDNGLGRPFVMSEFHYAMEALGVRDNWELFKTSMFEYIHWGKVGSFDSKSFKAAIAECDGGVESLDFEQQVSIKTVFGDVCINPDEYSICRDDMTDYFEAIKDGHAFIRYMTKSTTMTGKIRDQIFYLRSRGISYADALLLVWGNIKSQTLFWIEFHPAYVDQFTRGFDDYWNRKINYLTKSDRPDLLNFGPQWSNDEFLADYAKQNAA